MRQVPRPSARAVVDGGAVSGEQDVNPLNGSEGMAVRRSACAVLRERGTPLTTKELLPLVRPEVSYQRFMNYMREMRNDVLLVDRGGFTGNHLVWRWPTEDDLREQADELERRAIEQEWFDGLIPLDPEPKDAEEWQIAVDVAHGALVLDDCRMYGLIEGGPGVNRERCFVTLARGERFGFKPRMDAA